MEERNTKEVLFRYAHGDGLRGRARRGSTCSPRTPSSVVVNMATGQRIHREEEGAEPAAVSPTIRSHHGMQSTRSSTWSSPLKVRWRGPSPTGSSTGGDERTGHPALVAFGRYRDRLRKQGDRWRIAERFRRAGGLGRSDGGPSSPSVTPAHPTTTAIGLAPRQSGSGEEHWNAPDGSKERWRSSPAQGRPPGRGWVRARRPRSCWPARAHGSSPRRPFPRTRGGDEGDHP